MEQKQHHSLNYKVRSPWSWVFQHGLKDAALLHDLGVDISTELSSYRKFVSRPDSRKPGPCTLRAEIVALDEDGCEVVENLETQSCRIKKVVIGTSACLEGLSDKDLFASTMMKHNANFSIPPTLLIDWDVSEEDCRNIQFPICDGGKTANNEQEEIVAVLKTPLGSRGEGVFFVSTHEEIVDRVQDNYRRAVAEKNGTFLKDLLASKGRIPSWTLSGEIQSMLVRGRRKFHLRSYVAFIERAGFENKRSCLDGYVYNRHEVRVAENSVDDTIIHYNTAPSGATNRDRRAHITNGASSGETGRYMLHEIDELASLNMDKKLEEFLARVFDRLAPDLVSRVREINKEIENHQPDQRQHPEKATKFAIAGIDIMLDESERLYILEVNVNPAAPPEHVISDTFRSHLIQICQDLTRLVFIDDAMVPAPECIGGWKRMNSHAIL